MRNYMLFICEMKLCSIFVQLAFTRTNGTWNWFRERIFITGKSMLFESWFHSDVPILADQYCGMRYNGWSEPIFLLFNSEEIQPVYIQMDYVKHIVLCSILNGYIISISSSRWSHHRWPLSSWLQLASQSSLTNQMANSMIFRSVIVFSSEHQIIIIVILVIIDISEGFWEMSS